MVSKPPVQEWVIVDPESLARALDGIRKLHNLNLEGLRNRVGSQSPADIIRGIRPEMRSYIMLAVVKAFDMEWVLRASEDHQVEWPFDDQETFVAAIDAMRRHRGLSVQALFKKTGSRAMADLLRGNQANVNSRSLICSTNAVEFQLVLRKVKATSKAQRRLSLLKAAKEQGGERGLGKDAPDLETTQSDPRRDSTGRLKPGAVLTDREKAEAEALLDRYGGY